MTYLGPAVTPDGRRAFGPAEPAYPSDAWQRVYMARLAAQIVEWKVAYYAGRPLVDDRTFDLWWFNLLRLEARHPHLKDPQSVTDTVGAPRT